LESFGQVGILYVYIMLAILAVALGYLAFRGIEAIIPWITPGKSIQGNSKKNSDAPWIRTVFVSATVLFLSVFTLGILGVVGVGNDHNHGSNGQLSGNQTMNTSTGGYDYQQIQQMQSQLREISEQTMRIENFLRVR
jgi:hypothetical protein